jgi:23S rRNA pseudouridine1911/1915/1917 synthase
MDLQDFDSADYHVVPGDRHGLELDEYLCLLFPGATKGRLRRMVREGRVLVDGEPANPSDRVRAEQVLVIDLAEAPDVEGPSAPSEPVEVLYEDPSLLVVHKPAGLAVEPERWDRAAATLAGALLERARRDSDGGALDWRPRLCHRLDKDTTGCLAVARDLATERRLRRAFEEGRIDKRYLALVEGEYPAEDGEWVTIDRRIAPSDRRAGQMRTAANGKPARTDVRIARRFQGYTVVECRPRTGRTHQIRVHLADAGFPLVVDPLYGRRDALYLSEFKRGYRAKRGRPERPLIERLTLHAWRLVLPADGVEEEPPEELASAAGALADAAVDGWIAVEAPLPKDLERGVKQLGKARPWRR